MRTGKIGIGLLMVVLSIAIAIGMSASAEKTNGDTSTIVATSQESWVHGNVVQVEYPNWIIKTERKGWGTTFTGKNNTANWFHIPITTPVTVDWTKLPLRRIAVLYKTDGNAKITNIHVYDGKTKIKSFDGLSLSGDHSNFPLDTKNSWTISPSPTLGTGLNIAVRVSFGSKDNVGNPYPQIYFATAGADQFSGS